MKPSQSTFTEDELSTFWSLPRAIHVPCCLLFQYTNTATMTNITYDP